MLFLKVNKLKAKIIIISNLLFENWSGKKRLRRCLLELRVGFYCEVLSSCSRWYEEIQRLASHQRQLPNWTLWALNRKRILGANLFFAASMTGSSYLCGRGGASRCRSTEEGKEPLDWHHSYLCCLWSKLLKLAPCCPARKCWAIIGKYGGWQWCRLFSNFDWKWGGSSLQLRSYCGLWLKFESNDYQIPRNSSPVTFQIEFQFLTVGVKLKTSLFSHFSFHIFGQLGRVGKK